MNKKIFLYIIAAIMLIYGIIDYANYKKNNYDVTGFEFVCNNKICEIRHIQSNGNVKYTENIDIEKIEKFSTKLETVPRTDRNGLAIYAECKDGTEFRLSPIYVRPSKYVEKELINPLNLALTRTKININVRFP